MCESSLARQVPASPCATLDDLSDARTAAPRTRDATWPPNLEHQGFDGILVRCQSPKLQEVYVCYVMLCYVMLTPHQAKA